MTYDPKMNRLGVLRKMNGLDHKDMATKLDMALSTYTNFEYGYRELKACTLINICNMFNCSSDWLLGVRGTSDEIIRLENGDHND